MNRLSEQLTAIIRRFVADGRWHEHGKLVAPIFPEVPASDAMRHYEKREKMDRVPKRAGELADKIMFARNEMIYMALNDLKRKHALLQRDEAGQRSYWLIPRITKALKMKDPRYADLALGAIIADPELQPRPEMDDEVVQRYAVGLENGDLFPPVIVFHDKEKRYWLADGFYRLASHQRAKRKTIAACVFDGSRRDALLYSCGANEGHGSNRTDASRKRSVLRLLNDPEWKKESDGWIAKTCAVHRSLVQRYKTELSCYTSQDTEVVEEQGACENSYQENPQSESQETRTAHRGEQTYPMKTGRIGKPKPAKGRRPKPLLEQWLDLWHKMTREDKERGMGIVGEEGW